MSFEGTFEDMVGGSSLFFFTEASEIGAKDARLAGLKEWYQDKGMVRCSGNVGVLLALRWRQ